MYITLKLFCIIMCKYICNINYPIYIVSASFVSFSLALLPLRIASLNREQYSSIAQRESSFPGTGYVMRFGLQFVSTMPTVGMHILAACFTAVCSAMTVSSVLRKMHRSGSRVIVLYIFFEFGNRPPRQTRVCANSLHSLAVLSTMCVVCGFRDMNRIIPSRKAMCAVKFRACLSSSAV